MTTLPDSLTCSNNFERNGCCLLTQVLSRKSLEKLELIIEHLLQSNQPGVLSSNNVAYGIRNLLQLWPEVVELVRIDRVFSFVQQYLGDHFGVVRALLFDKPPEKSWSLPWHRDRTIAIKPGLNRDNLPRQLNNLTVKAGVPHAIASDRLLQKMITLRFSIDPMTPDNGPLVYLPGSHLLRDPQGDDFTAAAASIVFTNDEDLQSALESSSINQLNCNAGDLFAMRPLLAHSSRNSSSTTRLRRRVIHIELSPADDSVPWFEFVKVEPPALIA